MGVVQPGHRPQQGGLSGSVGAQQGQDLALGDLQVDVEEHLVGAVEEVEVVDLQGGHGPTGLAALALGVALEDVFDDQGDVPPHMREPMSSRTPPMAQTGPIRVSATVGPW